MGAVLVIAFIGLVPVLQGTAADITWEEDPQFHVEVNGKLDVSSRVYRPTDNRPVLLFMSDAFKSPMLIDLQKKTIMKVSKNGLTPRDEYSYTSSGIPGGKKVGSYNLEGGASVFTYNGKKVSISIKQSLVGEVSENIILAHSPIYAALRDRYKPKSKYINAIKSYSKPIDVVVMFATWCSTCKTVLPRFMSIMDAAGNANFSVKYIGIGMGGSEPREELDKYGHDYPAFIFYRNGKELDRIVGEPHVSLEQQIAEILQRGK